MRYNHQGCLGEDCTCVRCEVLLNRKKTPKTPTKKELLRIISRISTSLVLLLVATLAHAQHGINLTWTGSSGATSYNAYRAQAQCNTSPTLAQLVTGVSGTSYLDTAVLGSQHYCYAVTAVNSSGESAMSGTADALMIGTGPPALGQNCTSGCGIGVDIALTSINCHILNNNNPSDSSIPCQSTLGAYGSLGTAYDPSKLVFTFTTNTASYGEVRGGAYGVTDTIWDDTTVGTTHTVIVNHIVPAGGASPQPYYGYYIAACQHSFPCNNADGTWSSYPGPTSGVQGGHYFDVITPQPVPSIPSSWEINAVGHMPAWQGNFSTLPLFSIMKTGRFQNLPASGTTNNVVLQGNNNQWYYWNGSGWIQTAPQWYATTLTLTIGSTTYTCHPDAQGNHTAFPVSVENTCTNGASDSGSALVVYYNGVYGTQSQDLRPYKFDSSVGQYYLDVSTSNSPTGNPTPQITLEVYPGASAITGAVTANVTFTLYTGATGHVAAVPATSIALNIPVTIKTVTVLAPDPPGSFTSDTNLLSYEKHAAQSTINLCSNTSQTNSLLGWLDNLHTATWWSIGPPGYWGENQSWLYDQGKVYTSAQEQFMRTMTGGSWGDWASTSTFGNNYAHLIIQPSLNNTGGFFYMAMNSGTTGSSEPNWNLHTTEGATFTDGGVTWLVLGNQAYWEGCIEYATDPYTYAVITNGAQSTGQFSQYGGGSLKVGYQTGNAFPQDNSFVVGPYFRAVTDLGCANSGTSECSPDHAQTGLPNFMNVFSPSAGRGQGNFLESYAYNYRQEVFNGTGSNFTSDPVRVRNWQLTQNALIDYLYYTINQSNVGTVDPLDNLQVHADSFYFGIAMEALITDYLTVKLNDPTNVHGLLDARIPQAIKDFTDYMDANWFDQPFSQQGIHTYSIGFTPHDLEVVQGAGGGGTTNAFFNELTAFEVPATSWLYAYCGNSCTGPGGQGYDAISDLFRIGAFSAYHCTTFWFCTEFSDTLWLHNWQGATGSPKQLGMSFKTGLGNDEQWRGGYRAWSEMDIDTDRNPCRDGSNGSNPCALGHHSAYADVMPAYPYQLFGSGASRFGQYPYNQIDPTNCPVPCHFTGDKASPLSSVTANSVVVTAFTPEQATMKIGYSTDTSCTQGFATTEDAGFPQSVSVTTATIWQHEFTVNGLSPSTNYHFNFTTTDLAGNAFTTNCGQTPGNWSGGNLNVTTLAQTMLTILTTSLPNAAVGVSYSQTLQAAGGQPPYTWSISSGALPTGLMLDPVTGIIGGIPTTPGTFNFTAKVTDSVSNVATQPLTIIATNLQIITTTLPGATKGTAYLGTLQATGGTTPYGWSVKAGLLPPGLNLTTSSNQGIISGTPTTCGNFPVVWQVQDSELPPVTQTTPIPIVVTGCGLTIITTTLPTAQQNVSYTATLQASGGTGTGYTWSVTTGSLPTGLGLNSSTGVISGTPTVPGNYPFTVKVVDSGSNQATQPLSITVSSGLIITTTSLPGGQVGVLYSTAVQAANGTTPYLFCIEETGGICDDGTTGALPPGLALTNSANSGIIQGTPTVTGTSSFTVKVTDFLGAIATQPLSITITSTNPNSVTITGSTSITGSVVIK